MNDLKLQRHLNMSGIHIPTIVITAHPEDEMRELCMTAGADAYLLKPLEDLSLIAAINDVRARGA